MRTNRRDGQRSLLNTFQPFVPFGCLLVIALLLGPPLPALAAPGDFDPSFDADGRVLTHFGGFDEANALLVQSDGKLVAGGISNAVNPTSNDFALARYNPDGSLDTSFGSGGRVLTAFGGQDFIIALLQQADGKLVAAGTSNIGGDLDFALARYHPDGSLDASFGSAGRVITGFGGGEERIDALIQQPDGKLVAAGVTRIGASNSPRDFALARYNPDGSLDTGFDGDGRVLTDFGGNSDDIAQGLVQQPDGKLVAAGRSSNGAFALARYNPDGSLDASFGVGGRVLTDFGGAGAARALVRQPDGKLVAAGESSATGARDFTLARYNPDGSLDASFGVGGRVLTNFGGNSDDIASELVQQPDGKLVATGRSNASAAGRFDVALARYLPNGSLDGLRCRRSRAHRLRQYYLPILLYQPGSANRCQGGHSRAIRCQRGLRFRTGALLFDGRATPAAAYVWRPAGHDPRNRGYGHDARHSGQGCHPRIGGKRYHSGTRRQRCPVRGAG